jgi:hypothetical protein
MAVECRAGESAAARYRRRRPEHSILYRTVQQHLEPWLAHCREGDDGDGPVPEYVEREFRRYLDCGILACGFARAYCDACGHDFLVAFSCYPQRETICSSPLQTGYFLESSQGFQGLTPDSFSPASHAMSLSSTWNTPRRSSGGKAFSIASSFSVGSARR